MIIKQDTKEIFVGSIVCALIVMAFVTISGAGKERGADDFSSNTYEVSAIFDRIDGVLPGLEVRLAGIKIGKVKKVILEPNYQARVFFSITNDIKLPLDSSVTIETEGLLGGKYVEIVPGGDDVDIKPAGVIVHTQGSLMLDELLEKVTALMHTNKSKEK